MRVEQPDGKIMRATHTAQLVIDHLPDAVRQAHVFPEMHNKCLLALVFFLRQQLQGTPHRNTHLHHAHDRSCIVIDGAS